MKKVLLLFLLISSTHLFAGSWFSKATPPHINDQNEQASESDSRQDEQNDNDTKQVELEKCGKCNQLSDKAQFVSFCSVCKVKVCSSCDMSTCCDNELFLDKTSDFFFVKATCFSCNKQIVIRGINGLRQMIMYGRAHGDGEEYKKVGLSCGKLPLPDNND